MLCMSTPQQWAVAWSTLMAASDMPSDVIRRFCSCVEISWWLSVRVMACALIKLTDLAVLMDRLVCADQGLRGKSLGSMKKSLMENKD